MNVGDVVTARVTRVSGMLATIVADSRPGVIRGGAARQLREGQVIKVHITETNVGGRFEATLIHVSSG